jgi:hypothetical protein
MFNPKIHPIWPLLCVGLASLSPALPVSAQTESAPRLTFENRLIQGTLGKAYEEALDNLLRIDTVIDSKGEHNRS